MDLSLKVYIIAFALLFNLIFMMHMFGNGGNEWLLLSFGAHVFFTLVFGLGVIFLLIWAIKSMDKNQLKKWTKWLLIVGILGCLLTCAVGFFMMQKGIKDGSFDPGKMMYGGKCGKCSATTEVVAPAVE